MLRNPTMERLRAKISPEDDILIEESFALSNRINFLLKKHKISQRELAEKLGKSESEISKWLSGGHNFTSHTLIKIGLAIGERVYTIPTDIENNAEDIERIKSVLKSYIVRTLKQHVMQAKVNYQKFNSDNLSELEVNSTGVMINKKHEKLESGNFVQANLKPELFKNIEDSILN